MNINTLLEDVTMIINRASNIPNDIKPIVLAICRGYVRESKGLINLANIENVCNTVFVSIDESDIDFQGQNKILGETDTSYDQYGIVSHKMSYVYSTNYIKLITILTHELGHVLTEMNSFKSNDGKYNIIKKTSDFYLNCEYNNNQLMSSGLYGFRVTDGFLEYISSKIFLSPEFREELKSNDYDLKDYLYKDKRLFPSRIYDEYKSCFELFNYIMDNELYEFSCMKFESENELINYINNKKLKIIFEILDKSNNALWELKKYEFKLADEKFEKLLSDYKLLKDNSINLAYALLTFYKKSDQDPKFNDLLEKYVSMINEQNALPIENTQNDKVSESIHT